MCFFFQKILCELVTAMEVTPERRLLCRISDIVIDMSPQIKFTPSKRVQAQRRLNMPPISENIQDTCAHKMQNNPHYSKKTIEVKQRAFSFSAR